MTTEAHPFAEARQSLAAAGVFSLPTLTSQEHCGAPLTAAAANAQIESTAAALGGVSQLVALGTWHLALAAKVWTATYGVWMLSGLVPKGTAVGWTDTTLTLGPDYVRPLDPVGVLVAETLPILRDVRAAAQQAGKPAVGLLQGNEATALLSTHRVLSAAASSPTAATQAQGAALRTLHAAGLSAALHPTRVRDGQWIRWKRRSCCLYYKVPGGGYCGDCALI